MPAIHAVAFKCVKIINLKSPKTLHKCRFQDGLTRNLRKRLAQCVITGTRYGIKQPHAMKYLFVILLFTYSIGYGQLSMESASDTIAKYSARKVAEGELEVIAKHSQPAGRGMHRFGINAG